MSRPDGWPLPDTTTAMHGLSTPRNRTDQSGQLWQPVMPANSGQARWTGLPGDSLSLAVANAVRQAPGVVMVVTADMQSAEQLLDQYRFFGKPTDFPCMIFPALTTLPP